MTAYARAQDAEASAAAGFDLHVVKPIDPAALVQAVARSTGRTPRG